MCDAPPSVTDIFSGAFPLMWVFSHVLRPALIFVDICEVVYEICKLTVECRQFNKLI